MIPSGPEPTHAYEHWLRLQTERLIQDAIYMKENCGTAPLNTPATELMLSSYRSSVEGCLQAAEYDSARNHCIFRAKLLIQQAAWFHRLAVRHGSNPEGTDLPSSANDGSPTLPGEANPPTSEDPDSPGNLLREYRMNRHLSIQDVAFSILMTPTRLSHIEIGAIKPTFGEALKIFTGELTPDTVEKQVQAFKVINGWFTREFLAQQQNLPRFISFYINPDRLTPNSEGADLP